MSTTSNGVPFAAAAAVVARRAAALALAGTLLSGCAVAQFGGMFGSKQETTGSIAEAPMPQQSLSLAAATTTPVAHDLTAGDCPRISVSGGDGQLTVFDAGRVGDNLAIRHRGEITGTARECEISSEQVTVKYGIAGRVLLGPLGQTGTVRLPLLVNVTDSAQKTVKTEKISVAVNVDADKPYGNFSIVQRVTLPLAAGANPGDFKLSVSFDKKTPGAG
jgi:hypothetical protein